MDWWVVGALAFAMIVAFFKYNKEIMKGYTTVKESIERMRRQK